MKKLTVTNIAGVLLGVVLLTGCNNSSASDDTDPATASATTPATSAPATTPTSDEITAETIVGDWEAPEAQWVVHFKSDGTFVEDFEGVTDFRTGTFKVADGKITLEGGEGDNDEGTVEGDTLVFTLGTLKRQ